MAPFEVEVTISSAKDLKNVNWRHGDLRPYAVVWVDPIAKCTTRVDDRNDTSPTWNEKLTIPLHDRSFHDSTLFVDVVHANARDGTKPLVGSTRVSLRDVVEEVGLGGKWSTWLNLKRPSGRPHGSLGAKVEVRDLRYYAPPPVTYAPPYGQQATPYPYAAAPPAGYPYGQPAYGQPAYGAPAQDKKKGGKFGVGTGLAVGAAAGLLGGLAIAGAVDHVEGKIADDVAERVEDEHGYDDEGFGEDYF